MVTEERAREIRVAVQQIERITQRRIDIVLGEIIAFRAAAILAGFILCVNLVLELSNQNFRNAGILLIALALLWLGFQFIGYVYMKRTEKIRKEHRDQLEPYMKELEDD